jgi:methylated-DNA-[protein]-cysteine S-methyltransferase
VNHIYTQIFESPYGRLQIGIYDNQVCQLDWMYRKKRAWLDEKLAKHLGSTFEVRRLRLHDNCEEQLTAYFEQRRKEWALPILMVGSAFEKKVWQVLLHIPYGKCMTYSQLADAVGNRDATRAVANANGANQLAIIVPCHRVIGNNGALTGYSGGQDAKQKLIALEKNAIQCTLF